MIRIRLVSVLLLAALLPSAVPAAAGENQAAGSSANRVLPGAQTPVQPQPGLSGAEDTSAKPPLWSFVWLSDLHLDGSRLEYTAKVLDYIHAELKPHFVLLTGDNNAYAAPPADPLRPEPLGVRQQRFLRTFLDEHLHASDVRDRPAGGNSAPISGQSGSPALALAQPPYVLVTADNWTEGFDQVFGPHQYSFDCGGLHFLLVDPDRVHHGSGAEGLSVFDDAAWEWIRRDLDRNRDKPTILALHEPLVPPTFLDAPRLRGLVDQNPQVVAVLQGHLHVDMEFRRSGTTYLVAPSLSMTTPPAMKVVQVYPEGLVVRTIRDREAKGRFEMTSRRQRIAIPETLRGRLHKPPDARLVKANYDCVPAHPILDDPALAARAGELVRNGLESLWPAKAPPAR